MENSVFIKILEYGEECGLEGVHWEALLKKMQEEGVVSKEDQFSVEERNRLFKLFDECYDKPHGGSHTHRLLKTEYYFRLIEYRELQESREASRSANKNAFVALVISVVAILVGIISATIQLSSAVSIDAAQIHELVEAFSPPIVQEVTISDEQMLALISASKPPATQFVTISQKQLSELIASIETPKAREVFLTAEQMQAITQAINLNKSMQPTAKASAD